MTEKEFLERWAAECDEWQRIRDELAIRTPEGVTAYQVTLEQRKRALASGKKLLTPEEISTACDLRFDP